MHRGRALLAIPLAVEASLQLPVVQDLRGPQREMDFAGVFSLRIPFTFP